MHYSIYREHWEERDCLRSWPDLPCQPNSISSHWNSWKGVSSDTSIRTIRHITQSFTILMWHSSSFLAVERLRNKILHRNLHMHKEKVGLLYPSSDPGALPGRAAFSWAASTLNTKLPVDPEASKQPRRTCWTFWKPLCFPKPVFFRRFKILCLYN